MNKQSIIHIPKQIVLNVEGTLKQKSVPSDQSCYHLSDASLFTVWFVCCWYHQDGLGSIRLSINKPSIIQQSEQMVLNVEGTLKQKSFPSDYCCYHLSDTSIFNAWLVRRWCHEDGHVPT